MFLYIKSSNNHSNIYTNIFFIFILKLHTIEQKAVFSKFSLPNKASHLLLTKHKKEISYTTYNLSCI